MAILIVFYIMVVPMRIAFTYTDKSNFIRVGSW